MSCCGATRPSAPVFRRGFPTIWSWIQNTSGFEVVTPEVAAEILARRDQAVA